MKSSKDVRLSTIKEKLVLGLKVKSVGVRFPLFLDPLKRSFTASPIQDYKKTTNKRTMERNEFSSNNLVSQGGMSGKSHSGSDESLNGGTDSVKSSKVPSRII